MISYDPVNINLWFNSNDYSVIKDLIDKGFNINKKNKKGDNLAFHIIKNNMNTDIIKLLISYGLDVNEKNNDDYTCLYVAFLSMNKRQIEFLLENGAVIHDFNTYNSIAKKLASQNRFELVIILLDLGFDINNKKAELLKWVCFNNNTKYFDILVGRGINLSAKFDGNKTAIDYCSRDSKYIEKILKDRYGLRRVNDICVVS